MPFGSWMIQSLEPSLFQQDLNFSPPDQFLQMVHHLKVLQRKHIVNFPIILNAAYHTGRSSAGSLLELVYGGIDCSLYIRILTSVLHYWRLL